MVALVLDLKNLGYRTIEFFSSIENLCAYFCILFVYLMFLGDRNRKCYANSHIREYPSMGVGSGGRTTLPNFRGGIISFPPRFDIDFHVELILCTLNNAHAFKAKVLSNSILCSHIHFTSCVWCIDNFSVSVVLLILCYWQSSTCSSLLLKPMSPISRM